MNVEIAVILAAGDGGRLSRALHDRPKAFIQFGEKPIIEESIETLLNFQFKQVVVVVGYRSESFEDLGRRYGCIRLVSNDAYNDSGTMYSLYCARDAIAGGFLLLESDLIYEPRAVEELLKHPGQNVTLLSGFTFAGDEVFVEARDGRLVNMSKDRTRLEGVSGEFVGISKVSLPLYRAMLDWCGERFGESKMLDYETDAMVGMARKQPIFCHKVEDLLWCEIDDARHYVNAREKIYPRVRSKERLTGPVS